VLGWLGRQGTRAVAALVVAGIALPPLGTLLAPYVTEAVFLLLVLAFLRVDTVAFGAYVRRPALVLAGSAWTMIVIPLLFAASCWPFRLAQAAPDLFLGLMLQGIASPMMATPALAALLGLDATLVLATLLMSSALVPLTAPVLAFLFLGSALTLSPLALGGKLLGLLAGAALFGGVIRRLVGSAAIARHKAPLDGVNVLVLFVFVAAVMRSVAARVIAAPLATVGVAVLGFVVFFAVLFFTAVVFRYFVGEDRGLAVGFLTAQRNLGLMLAATGGAIPEFTWLYIAVAQFPIYLSPYLLTPIARRALAAKNNRGRQA